ncbi:MAG: AarF/ABC1/UbiB kinase family protein [Sporomusaceae bacterium]|nr:AarF/ABC1/UbiB kinase family protein [Sporomusaceae bacterium]
MFAKKVRHLNRYREIAAALLSQGFDYIAEEIGLSRKLPYYQRLQPRFGDEKKGGIGERLRLVFEQLGPTYVKFGQIASTRPDLLPPEIICELEKLQDNVPGVPFEAIAAVVESELGQPLPQLFRRFEPEPLAAASVGQVHKAVLQTGEEVAVKVQRPSIAADIETDLEILYELARLAESRFHWAQAYQLVDMIDEFAKAIRSELDYSSEGRHSERIAHQFADDPRIAVPAVYWQYTTAKVLTTQYIDGIKISQTELLLQRGYQLPRLAERFAKAILQQIFIEGFFHGDPHPGNVAVLPQETIVFLDFGMVGRLNPDMQQHLSSLVIGLMRRDASELAQTVLQMGIAPELVNKQQLRDDIDLLQEKYYGVALSRIRLGEAVNTVFSIALKHQIRMPADLILVGKTLLTMEGTVEKLAPELSILDVADPFGKKILLRRLQPQNLLRALRQNAGSFSELAVKLPQYIRELQSVINRGRLRHEIAIPDIEQFLRAQDRISNRLAFSIVLLAFSMIMSSIIISLSIVGQDSLLWRLPLVEIGFGIAVLMLLWLLYAIFRSGRL